MNSFQFHPIFPVPYLLGCALVGLVLLVYFEIKRNHKFLVLRIVLQFLVISALLGLALKPKRLKATEGQTILLLTKGYNKTQADSLLQVLKNPLLYHQPGEDRYRQSIAFESMSELEGQQLFVLGSGIPYYDLPRLHVSSFHYFPAPISGVYSLINDSPYTIHHTSWIRGTTKLDIPQTKLILEGPEGSLDSMTIENPGLTSFAFRFIPKVEGQYLYKLTLKDSIGDTLSSSVVPVRVAPERKLTILMIQDYPSVEMRFLKNFLGGKGHSLGLRYGVSKNISQSEFINMEKESLDKLSTEMINKFDLVILRDATYANLPTSSQQLMANAVNEGLGIIILVDEPPSKQVQELLPINFTKTDHDTVRVVLGGDGFTISGVRVAPVRNDALVSVLENDRQILEGYVLQGSGHVGFQLMNETFPLLLQEKENDYAKVWTPLLEAVARKEIINNQLKIITPFPWRKDEPVEVEVLTQGTNPVLMLDDEVVPMLEDSRLDDCWTTTIWPSQEGWNSLSILDDSTTLDFYVSGEGEWESLRSVNQMEANSFYTAIPTQHIELPTIEDEISPLLFFIIFLLASGALWLLPKL